ncbi:50S ribosome-binding GTPase [Candidatus Woesearchaeota archaeon]|nr:50S ribosome-binding GTPase [Candidatus Woesearchaeota archaeon]
MAFQDIKPVEKADFYLDVAFRRAKELSAAHRLKVKIITKLQKSKELELYKLEVVKGNLLSDLGKLTKAFPSIKDLDPFYNELMKVTLDVDYLRQSLGSLGWARDKIQEFHRSYAGRIRSSTDIPTLNRHRQAFYGRISSVMKQIAKHLAYLEESRKIMKDFPVIKTSLKTIVITGFPNVGKTTLLYKLTGSKPDIQNYPFTTVGINVGYIKTGEEKLQLLDTPGSLNRFDKMNNIEKQAFLALRYLASAIVYVFDLTEAYPLDKQVELYKAIKKSGKPIIVYLSKVDLTKDKELVERFEKEYSALKTVDELKAEIIKL